MALSLAEVRERHFKGLRFRSSYLKRAGKILKKEGEAACVAYLTGKDEESPPNFKPPAKCDVVAQSRPFEEWPIVQASVAVQSYVYGLTKEAFEAFNPGTTKQSHEACLAATGIDTCGYSNVQGLNLIFRQAKNRYEGVITKVENRNKKAKKKLTRKNEWRQKNGHSELPEAPEELTFNDEGRLLQPPGINPSLYTYQQISPTPWSPKDSSILPPQYAGYERDPNAPIPFGVAKDRLTIASGCPGYIPEWMRTAGEKTNPRTQKKFMHPGLSTRKNKRMRLPRSVRSAPLGALLVTIHLGEDWLVLDVRGLLRNARWRGVAPKDISTQGLLNLFTGDPVIDTRRGVVTFTYKPETVGIHSRTWLYKGKQTKEVLEKLTQDQTVALVAIDLGQTNPVSAAASRVSRSGENLSIETVDRFFLPDELIKELRLYRMAHDRLEERIREESTLALTEAQQAEVRALEHVVRDDAKNKVCAAFNLDAASLPWDQMTSNTTYLSEAILAQGVSRDQVFFTPNPKKGSKEPVEVMRKDRAWVYAFKAKLSEETRKAKNEALWALKRASPDYARLSKRREELCRRSVNMVINRAKKRTQCQVVIPVLEDLNIGFFHGSGKRLPGWDNFFVAKKENRWLMNGLHKSFSDLAVHRGFYVFEVMPHRTSITCPACGHCDSENRDGEAFVCLSCKRTYHADLDVATHNLTQVAGTGLPMPEREHPGGTKKPGGSRKPESPQTHAPILHRTDYSESADRLGS